MHQALHTIPRMTVSVVIPTLNESNTIGETIRSVRAQCPREIIVVDGGSCDDTIEQASAASFIVSSEPGRARQMNVGAAWASGEVLLFLHADCRPEVGALAEATSLLSRPDVVAGCFRMCIGADSAIYRLIDAGAAARVRLAGLVYGDQGLFLRRKDFHRLGGFPPLNFMEDVFFSQSLRRHGRILVGRRRIHVSSRRWQHAGFIRQTLRNWLLLALAVAGCNPDHLGRYYPHVR
jgi:rSAM/selenodomain-associated transferase 2